jgi:hypothetical protein
MSFMPEAVTVLQDVLRVRPVDKNVEDAWFNSINGMNPSSASFHDPLGALRKYADKCIRNSYGGRTI